ncbi:TlpA family protein disulfide reductase [Streptomyces sp. NPDC059875]|uniref:TlpA family protein disulfide reductase n=1 Tax=unclassified Streptomyces TaxID=2593676 RepID=UPI00365BCCF5
MAYLTASVVLLGVLSLLNLALTFGVVRRLRERPADATGGGGGEMSVPALVAAPGAHIGTFSAVDTEGSVVDQDALDDGSMVLFMSPGCPACEDLLPLVAERAGQYGRDRVLAVVTRDDEKEARLGDYLRRLSPVARVVVTEFGDEVTRAFAVKGMPAYVEVGADGRVAGSGRTLPRRTDRAGAAG